MPRGPLTRSRVTPAESHAFAQAYASGKNTAAIGRATRRGPRTITRHLKNQGVALRANQKYDETKIVADYNAGLSLRQTAAANEISYGTAHRLVTKAKVMRARGGAGRTGVKTAVAA